MSLPNFADPAISHRNHTNAVVRHKIPIVKLTDDDTTDVIAEYMSKEPGLRQGLPRLTAEMNEGFKKSSTADDPNRDFETRKYFRLKGLKNKVLIDYITNMNINKRYIQENVSKIIDQYNNGELGNDDRVATRIALERLRMFPLIIDKPEKDRPELARKYQQAVGVAGEREFTNHLSTIFPSSRWTISKQEDNLVNDYKIIDTQNEYAPIYIEFKLRKEKVEYEWLEGKWEREIPVENIERYVLNLISAPLKEYNRGNGIFCPNKKGEQFDKDANGKNCYFVNKISGGKNIPIGTPTYAIYKYNKEKFDNYNLSGKWEPQRDIPWEDFDYIEINKFNGELGFKMFKGLEK